MAVYVYRCPQCGRQREERHDLDDAPTYWCPDCSYGKCVYMVRVYTAPEIIVKGGTRKVG